MFYKHFLLYFLCILFLISCSYIGFNDSFFLNSSKNDLWGKLCNWGVKQNVIYEKDNTIYDYTGRIFVDYKNRVSTDYENKKAEIIEANKGVILTPSKCNRVPENFLKASLWRWRPKKSTFMYEIIFNGENKVIEVNKMMMK